MDHFEAHFTKKTKRRCPMCGGRKFEFSVNPLGMFRVDARASVKIPDLEQGRVLVFVNCIECEYYIFSMPDTVLLYNYKYSISHQTRMHQTLSFASCGGGLGLSSLGLFEF